MLLYLSQTCQSTIISSHGQVWCDSIPVAWLPPTFCFVLHVSSCSLTSYPVSLWYFLVSAGSSQLSSVYGSTSPATTPPVYGSSITGATLAVYVSYLTRTHPCKHSSGLFKLITTTLSVYGSGLTGLTLAIYVFCFDQKCKVLLKRWDDSRCLTEAQSCCGHSYHFRL